MNQFKKYLMIDCYAFTAVVLANAIFQALNIASEVPMKYSLYIFLVSSVIAFLMFLTDQFIVSNGIVKGIVHILAVLVPVFLSNMLQSGFQLKLIETLIVIGFSLVIYGIVYLMMYLSYREKDAKLNESIQKMRAKKQKS